MHIVVRMDSLLPFVGSIFGIFLTKSFNRSDNMYEFLLEMKEHYSIPNNPDDKHVPFAVIVFMLFYALKSGTNLDGKKNPDFISFLSKTGASWSEVDNKFFWERILPLLSKEIYSETMKLTFIIEFEAFFNCKHEFSKYCAKNDSFFKDSHFFRPISYYIVQLEHNLKKRYEEEYYHNVIPKWITETLYVDGSDKTTFVTKLDV